jgi:hypothetical protein
MHISLSLVSADLNAKTFAEYADKDKGKSWYVV